MKKKLLLLVSALLVVAGLSAGCSGISQDADSEDSIANPWTDATPESITTMLGATFNVPEGAENVTYQVNENDLMAQMKYTDDAGTEFTARIKPTTGAKDISGAYYTWENTENFTMGDSDAIFSQAKDGDDTVELIIFYNESTGFSCSLMAVGPDLDGLDLQGWAEVIFPQ